MDLIVGESLQSKLKREGALPEKLVSSYLNQLLSALMVVHEKNIWHLDIKPANIMVDKYGHIYLIDFGASKHIEQNYGSLTTSSMMLGSQGFCPPEQCDNAMLKCNYQWREQCFRVSKHCIPKDARACHLDDEGKQK